MNEATSIVRGTFDSSLNYMNLGFTLVSAMAWADLAKRMTKNIASQSNNRSRIYVYPVLVTLMAVVVLNLSKHINPNTKRPVVVPIVSA